jgi:mannose-6-phosphate isomerase-like protein (cupin superfamily)
MTDDDSAAPVDVAGMAGEGPVWGMASEDLNATLLSWGPGQGVNEHVNGERDVLLFIIDGSGTVGVDDRDYAVRRGQVLLLRKGARRSIRGGPCGLRYLSVHLRRVGVQIETTRAE